MIKRSLSHIRKMLNASIDENFKDVDINGISIDSRTIDKDNLYIPIVGEKFDGRIFIKECEEKGASAFIIDKSYSIPSNIKIPYVIVEDTKKSTPTSCKRIYKRSKSKDNCNNRIKWQDNHKRLDVFSNKEKIQSQKDNGKSK